MFDPVNHPAHYTTHPSGVEVITYSRLLPFSPGNAVKYVMRRDLKNNAVQDLDKALWYLEDALISGFHDYPLTHRMGRIIAPVIHHEPNATVKQFLAAMYLPVPGRVYKIPDLDLAKGLVTALREEY